MSDGRLVILAGGISSRMKKPDYNGYIDQKLITEANEKVKSMIGVGDNYRPFLDYLLFNARESSYKDILIVIGEKDESIREYYGNKDNGNEFFDLKISYAVQKIYKDHVKPLGTADALFQGLLTKNDWKGAKFTVCNSDNLYSIKALKLVLETPYKNAMIDYDRDAFEFEKERVEKFAVTMKDQERFPLNVIEKPSAAQIKTIEDKNGYVGVSMNIFSFEYDMILPYLEQVPIHPERNEKELPSAVVMMITDHPKSMFTYPLSEHVPDLTYKDDIIPVKNYLEKNYQKLFY